MNITEPLTSQIQIEISGVQTPAVSTTWGKIRLYGGAIKVGAHTIRAAIRLLC